MKYLILLLSLIGDLSFAKRLPPAEIKLIMKNGTEFAFRIKENSCKDKINLCGMQVYLFSKKSSTGKLNWERKLYQKLYDPKLEIDVQTVLPQTLIFKDEGKLLATDERESTYLV